tara:strand:- start:16270 stop:17121 length:852 start_codon:yes stop_codon:yes gene_type:complete
MNFNKNLAAVHGYLCADGYVTRNPKNQRHKYYHIGLRNTNEVLLKDFQTKFKLIFGLKSIITNEGRCKIQNKDVYYILTKNYSYYSYEWKLPQLSKENLKFWLRAFFDCEGWVENQPAKSRLIGVDCCNKTGLLSIQVALKKFKIDSKIHKKKDRMIWRLTICDLSNLKRFHKNIGFLHPNKNKKLLEAIDSYKDYFWKIPNNKRGLLEFVRVNGKTRESRNEIRFCSIKKVNLINLKKALNKYKINSKLFGPWKNNTGSEYYYLIIKDYGGKINNGKTKWTT